MNKISEKLRRAIGINAPDCGFSFFADYTTAAAWAGFGEFIKAFGSVLVYTKHLRNNITRFANCNDIAYSDSFFGYKILIMKSCAGNRCARKVHRLKHRRWG